jgi:O-succinylbenzoate synthase
MKLDIVKFQLNLGFHATTSRGSMTTRDTYFAIVRKDDSGVFGIGECGPLPGLSPDLDGNLDDVFAHCKTALLGLDALEADQIKNILPGNYPAVLFALETAVTDLLNGGVRSIYNNLFYNGKIAIPINGLVWMGNREEMIKRLDEKVQEGYGCIKIKIGGINFDDEIAILKHLRKKYSAKEIAIRLDANGAFAPRGALRKLEKLAKFDIHSIEQPLAPGQLEEMGDLCKNTPIPIALDEELIGLHSTDDKRKLLDEINPHFLVLKPTLIGGLHEAEEWIQIAAQREIDWWVTSALESNVGLNAIAQFVANHQLQLPQGLGTGQLFTNNISSPLQVKNTKLVYSPEKPWDFQGIVPTIN